jgi:phenylacetate-CoA ligase
MFNVIQEQVDRIEINIVTLNNRPLDQSVELDIIKNIKKVMSEECKVNINYVDDINPSISGKNRYTISKVN